MAGSDNYFSTMSEDEAANPFKNSIKLNKCFDESGNYRSSRSKTKPGFTKHFDGSGNYKAGR
jgi:hypothetical protein